MQGVEEKTGAAGSFTATGTTASTGDTMVQPTSSTSSTTVVSPAATSVTPTPLAAAVPTVPAPQRNPLSGFALDRELQVEAMRVLDMMRHGHVKLALSIMRRMTASPEAQWARLEEHQLPAKRAFAAVQGGDDPFERTYEVHAVLLDLLEGLGAQDLFLLVRLVTRIRAMNGVAPDSFEAEEERLFAEDGDEGDIDDTSTQLPLGWTPPNSTPPGAALETPSSPSAEGETSTSDDEPVPDTMRAYPASSSRVELDTTLDGLGGDEIAVLARIAQRLEMGQKHYGPLHIALDPRAFRSKEAREELEDLLVYIGCAWLKAESQEVA
jgi:hypothetical protein